MTFFESKSASLLRVSLEFKFRTSQIWHSIANGSPPLLHLCKELCCFGSASPRRWAPQTRYTLRRNTVHRM